jgi:multicomponent Na+:H+ antiporter subunit D
VLTAGAVLRSTARVFFGWGPKERSDRYASGEAEVEDPEVEDPETLEGRDRTPPTMWVPAMTFLAAAIVLGTWTPAADGVEGAADRFTDVDAYHALVLEGSSAPIRPVHHVAPKGSSYWLGFGSLAGAMVVAALALQRGRLPPGLRRSAHRSFGVALDGLRALHSGKVGDYVAWLTAGAAALGGVFAILLGG